MAAIFIGVGVIIFFLSMGFAQSSSGMIIGLLVAAAGIPFCIGTTKKYKELYKEIFVQVPLKKNFDNVFYAWKSGFNEHTVRNFRLFDMGNIFSSEDYLKASYKGINFELSDVTIRKKQGKTCQD